MLQCGPVQVGKTSALASEGAPRAGRHWDQPESEDQGMEEEKPPEVTCVCQEDRAERG